MGKIILARHGESEDNERGVLAGSRDSILTARGHMHGYGLASNIHTVLGSKEINKIIASPLRRAHKTATICANEFSKAHRKKLFVQTSKILQERHFGKLEGIPLSDIPKNATSHRLCIDGITVYVEEAEEAESMEQLYDRAGKALAFLKEETKKVQGDMLVVAHAGIVQMLYLQHYGKPWEDIFQIPFLHNGHFLVIE